MRSRQCCRAVAEIQEPRHCHRDYSSSSSCSLSRQRIDIPQYARQMSLDPLREHKTSMQQAAETEAEEGKAERERVGTTLCEVALLEA